MVVKIVGYVATFLAGCLVMVLALFIGVSEDSESNSEVMCWNFPTQPTAQAFYDAVKRDDDPSFYGWLDPDADGIACEELPAR